MDGFKVVDRELVYNRAIFKSDVMAIINYGDRYLRMPNQVTAEFFQTAYELLDKAQKHYGKPFDALPKDNFYEIFRTRLLLSRFRKFMDDVFKNRNAKAISKLEYISLAFDNPQFLESVE